jgi:hypothetical protein
MSLDWHKVMDAHPAKKKELMRLMKPKKLTDLMLDLGYAHSNKPIQRVVFTNFKTRKQTWIDVQYVGRAPVLRPGSRLSKS